MTLFELSVLAYSKPNELIFQLKCKRAVKELNVSQSVFACENYNYEVIIFHSIAYSILVF